MINLDRYEFSAEDSALEKLDAKLGNWLVRSEEIAEDKHIAKREKLRGKYLKAKMKADALQAQYEAKQHSKWTARVSNYVDNCRVIDI